MMRLLLPLLLLLLPGAARAEWLEAVSKHFIVYSQGKEAELRKAASDLERYDYLLRLMLKIPPDHPTRLKVYLMRDMEAVQQTTGWGTGTSVAGYYHASPRGSMAVGMRKEEDFAEMGQLVLFHEYAHHLMLQHFSSVYPMWYVEGFAEYYGATRILPNGYEVGHMAPLRSGAFSGGSWLPLKKLLTARSYKDIDYRPDLLYAQGWLLVHYLASNRERSGQLGKYLALINNGSDYKSAMDAAFGADAAKLNAELDRYSKRNRLEVMRITFPDTGTGTIDIRPVSPARSALMEQEIELGRGVFIKDIELFAARVRKKAQLFPADPDALAMLAEAERIYGDKAAAAAAADRWLALRPGEPRALMLKGRLGIDALAAAGSKDADAWRAARKPIEDARTAAPSDPLILETYYDGYAADGSLPPPRAQNALYRAMELVPQDKKLRFKVAADFERRGLIEAAIHAIRPAAFGAHASEDENEKQKAKREKLEGKWRRFGAPKTESARDMLDRLERKFEAGGTTTAAKL